jgi:predicted permease
MVASKGVKNLQASTIRNIALAWVLTRALNAWRLPSPIPLSVRFEVNPSVLAVAVATMLGTALLAGLAPALQGTRIDLSVAMKEGGLQSSRRRGRLRSTFVVAQVALSVVLLAVAGLFGRSLQRALAVDPGFQAAGVVHAGVGLQPHGYDRARARVLFARLTEALRARPEVAAASFAGNAPLSGSTSTSGARRTDNPDLVRVETQWTVADVGFAELLRIPLLAGRTFTAADDSAATAVTVINELLARRLWPDTPLGEVLGRQLEGEGRTRTVVGVIGQGKYSLLQEDDRAFALLPLAQKFTLSPLLYVRARGTTDAALRAAREELAALDPNVALERPTLLTEDVNKFVLPQRVGAVLVGMFGLIGLVLSMTGLYGVLAFGVAQRMREFGVRMALGAGGRDIVRLVLRGGVRLVALGIALGLLASLAAGRVVTRFLFGVSPLDPVTLVVVPAVLLVVAAAASLVPARRAAGADPMASLRAE